jgi:hypothetical protein
MPIPGNLLTTAMVVMPQRDVDRALELSLSLEVPYWPQLPKGQLLRRGEPAVAGHLLLGRSGRGKGRGKSLPMVKDLSARFREKFKLS